LAGKAGQGWPVPILGVQPGRRSGGVIAGYDVAARGEPPPTGVETARSCRPIPGLSRGCNVVLCIGHRGSGAHHGAA